MLGREMKLFQDNPNPPDLPYQCGVACLIYSQGRASATVDGAAVNSINCHPNYT